MPYETVLLPNEIGYIVKSIELGFAEIKLRISPSEERIPKINLVTQATDIPEQFVQACLEGIQDRLDSGIIAGYPVEYIEVNILQFRVHPQDSTCEAFESAGFHGLKWAFIEANPIVVEDD